MKLLSALLLGAILLSSPVTAQAIPIGPSVGPISSSSPASLNGPGYSAGPWYLPTGVTGRNSTGAAVASITTAYCSVGWFGNISPTGGTGTLGFIGFDAMVAGTTTVQAAIYANDATVTPNRPGALVASSSAVSTTTGQPLPAFSPGVQIAANSLYWICLQAGDTTFKYGTMLGNTTGTQSTFLQYVGASNIGGFGAGGGNAVNGVSTTTGITSYGTWPATLHGAVFSDTAQSPWFGFQFASIP